MNYYTQIPQQLVGILLLLCGSAVAFSSTTALFGITQRATIVDPSTVLYMAGRGGGGGNRQRRFSAPVKENKPPMNDEIDFPQVRVMTPNPKGKDEPLGIMSTEEALLKAKELGDLDLILINETSDPPVCKIVDYSKYRYMQEKKQKEIKKNSKASELKEVKMSYKIDVHDYDVRKKSAYKFLTQGNRVKCTVMFRGREVQHDNLGFDLLEKLAGELEDTCIKEGRPKREGRNLSLILTPRPEVMKAVNQIRRASDKAKKQKKANSFSSADTNGSTDDDDDDAELTKVAAAAVSEQPKPKVEKTLEEILGTDEYL